MFQENSLVIVIDTKKRKYIFELKKDGVFHYHRGQIKHNDIIGKSEGCIIYSSKNERLLVLKPTLADYILFKLKRGGQIIYPKDIGQILVLGDVFEGAKVFECGTGSGALTLFLLRAVGEKGKVVSCDNRDDMLKIAKKNIEDYYKKPIEEIKNIKLLNFDFKQQLPEDIFDRVIIDIPDPWTVLVNVYKILDFSGLAIFWLPTVLQVFTLIDTIEKEFSDKFILQDIYETLQREWQKKQKSLRPKDRMVAHTGFLIILRKCSNAGLEKYVNENY